MRTWPLAVLVALVSVTFAAPSAAQTSDVPVPEPLEPWVDWVEYEHPEWDCPRLGGERACVWPGRLQLEVTETGGSFQMEVWLARATTVELPGGDGYWPQSVESSADSLLVTESASGGPAARLPAGEHQIRGTFEWESPPEMLPIPETSGRVTLQIEGERIDRPRIDDQHRIWLRDETDGRGKDDSNTIRVSVYRRLQDGVPLEVTTKLEMNVSGRARKVGLGEVLLEATRPTEVDSPLPVQIEGRSLQVYVKPGTHEVDITSVLPDSVSSLDVPEPEPDLYDPQEVWIWQGHETIRSVRLSGLSNVDPDRTSLPGGLARTYDPAGSARSYSRMDGDPARDSALAQQTRAQTRTLARSRRPWLHHSRSPQRDHASQVASRLHGRCQTGTRSRSRQRGRSPRDQRSGDGGTWRRIAQAKATITGRLASRKGARRDIDRRLGSGRAESRSRSPFAPKMEPLYGHWSR